MPILRRILAIAPLLIALHVPVASAQAEDIRLAPPQAMFRDSISLQQFVQGTLRFVLLHETGHAFVDLYDIPVLGREEDAADRFATWWMSPNAQQDGTDAIAAVEWWLASGRSNPASREQMAWWDEHGIDEQRGYQIICLLYGADPQTMGPLAGRHGLPEARRESCIPEAAQNAASWKIHLSGNAAQLTHQLDGFLVPVNHSAPDQAGFNDALTLVKDWRLLEDLADLLRQFRFPDGKVMIRLHAQECGMPNAYWNPQDQSIVLCYELVAHIADIGQAAGFR